MLASVPHETLGRAATRIINEVRGINRIVYDITSKPPARSSESEGERRLNFTFASVGIRKIYGIS